jgi:hypothetical protein
MDYPGFKHFKLNFPGLANAANIAVEFDRLLDALMSEPCGCATNSREFALVKTKLEEACFYAKKSMAIRPEKQDGYSPHQNSGTAQGQPARVVIVDVSALAAQGQPAPAPSIWDGVQTNERGSVDFAPTPDPWALLEAVVPTLGFICDDCTCDDQRCDHRPAFRAARAALAARNK